MTAADTTKTPTIHVVGNVNIDLIMGVLPTWPAIGTETVLDQSEFRVGGLPATPPWRLARLMHSFASSPPAAAISSVTGWRTNSAPTLSRAPAAMSQRQYPSVSSTPLANELF